MGSGVVEMRPGNMLRLLGHSDHGSRSLENKHYAPARRRHGAKHTECMFGPASTGGVEVLFNARGNVRLDP